MPLPSSKAFRRVSFALAIGASVLSAGCSNLLYKATGDTMVGFGKDKMLPYLLTTDDPDLGCTGGEAMTPLFLAFGTVTTPPDDLAVLIYMVDAGCATKRAEQFNLEALRATRERRIEAAQDARIASKRWHAIAAQRGLNGYKSLVRAMGEPGGECPNFKSEFDQMVWLLGTAVGLQAVMSGAQSDGAVTVPLDIAPKAERAAACLDTPEGNQRWWGLPQGIRAALWTIVPGLGPSDKDPWKMLDGAIAMGEEQGVRVVSGLAGGIAYNADNMSKVREIIRRHANSVKTTAGNPEYRMVDIMGTDMLLSISDRLWTEATGHRTPMGAYGTFWDDKPAKSKVEVNLDDLL